MHFSASKLLKNLLFGFYFRLYADGDGGGGGGGIEITPEIQAVIDAAVATNVEGLKAKNAELIGKVKTVGDQLKAFEGIDPVKTKEMLARFENDEEAKLIAEGKISEVIEGRTARLRADAEKKIQDALKEAQAATNRASAFQGQVLDNALRAAAAETGIHKHAVEDALLRGRSMFTLSEDGKAVQLGDDGQPVLGKDGKTPFSPTEWLDTMKETAPHWFPSGSSGGGSGGNSKDGGSSGAKAMKRSAFEALPANEKAAFATGGGQITD